MTKFIFLLILSSLTYLSTAQDSIGCYNRGECLQSLFADVSTTSTPVDCLRFCKNTDGCSYFTHFSSDDLCFAFVNCHLFSTNSCADCISGDSDCPEVDLQCFVQGRCDGTFLGYESQITSPQQCLDVCVANNECLWWSHDSSTDVCILTSDCPVLDRSCGTCTSGQRECGDLTQTTTASATTTYEDTTTPWLTTTTSPEWPTTIYTHPPTTTGYPETTGYTDWPTTELPCGENIYASSGSIQSPNYPNDYDNYEYCVWVITVPSSSSKVAIQFNDFELEPSCTSCDYVELRDGPIASSPIIIRLTDANVVLGRQYLSESGNQMRILFRTDGSVKDRGFSATFQSF